MDKTIAVIPGDGIGPEIMAEAIKVLKEIEAIFGHRFNYHFAPIGGAAWETHGTHFPQETADICKNADAVLFGSVGGPVQDRLSPKWNGCEKNSILALRSQMELSCNIRPVHGIDSGIDIFCVRELSEDVYFGSHETSGGVGERVAKDRMVYSEKTIRRIAHQAFQFAMSRGKKVTSVDKANVLDCSKLWREVVEEVSEEYPECNIEHMLVDNCAMQLARNPNRFDVLLMPNLFGDILSDLASVWGGSLGMLPSASFNAQGKGLYEPAGGSAPDIAGKGIANPVGQILSAALMLKYSFGMEREHNVIVEAIQKAIQEGYRTQDIANSKKHCTTAEMGDAIVANMRKKEPRTTTPSVMPFCYKAGKIIPKNQATVSIASHSLQYGSTCFAGIRAYFRNGKVRIFRLRDHFERLMDASKIMGFGFQMTYDEFHSVMTQLIEANRPETDFYIRPFLFSEKEVIGVSYQGVTFDLGVYLIPLSSYYKMDQGLRLTISSWQKISDGAMPTKAKAGGCYVNSSMATNDAKAAGYDEALMMDRNQNIVEASVANFFLVRRGEIFTPPVGADVLEGITMRTVIDLLEERGYKVRFEPISRSMVYSCDELFLTGTAAGVVFAKSVDGRMVGDGKEGAITAQVRRDFQSLIEMEHPRSKEWVVS